MHIEPTSLLENGVATTNYDLERGLCGGSQGLDWGDNKKIEEAVVDTKDDEDKAKDPWEKNKRLKREKMHKKRLSKAKKKACLEAEKADNDKKPSNKDADFLVSTVAAFAGLSALVAISLGPFAPVAAFSGPLTPASITLSPANATSASVSICPSFFSFLIWPSPFFFPTRHTTPTFPFLMQVFRFILLPLEDNYSV